VLMPPLSISMRQIEALTAIVKESIRIVTTPMRSKGTC